MSAIVLLCIFVVLLISGVSISVSMGLSSLIYLLIFMDVPPIVIVQQMIGGVNKFALLAIPFFMLAGAYMEHGGISQRIIKFTKSIVGPLPGGLALVVVFASVIFAAMTGSGVATCAAVGGIMFPIMKREGYDEDFTCALQATSGILGPLIPPSILMVVYGVATNVSISDLLIGGLLPGIVMGLLFAIVSTYICKKRGWKGEGKFSIKEVGSSFIQAIWALLVPLIILGGIYSGFCTPTEAAALATLYALIIGTFVYKELKIRNTIRITVATLKQMGGLTVIVAAAQAFAWILTKERIPQIIAEALISVSDNRFVFLGLVTALLLFVGCFLDATPSVLILGPILAPAALQYGFDPVHFGVIIVVGVLLGLVTPPVGANLFVVSAMTGRPMQKFLPEIVPFLLIFFVGFVIIMLVPAFSTFLPSLLH